jgi:cephalosporin-C deacetylase-like acetyl esterase
LVNQATPWRPNFRCGAAIGWPAIKSTVPEPTDFDAFWKKKLDELAAVPMNPVLEEVADSGSPDVQLWKITLDGIRGTKVYGYLARPRGNRPLPAQLQLQYWGLYPLKKSEVVGIAQKGWIAMNIMAHDLPCDRDTAFYKDPGINTYVNTGAADPDKSYFLRMFLSCCRAVDYLAGRSDWNHLALLVHGGSQGGFQGIATAGLNPHVTALTVFVPGGCDLTGSLEGRPSGWPGWVNSRAKGAERAAMIQTAGYYDAKNFAKRIKCPVLVGTGLCDTIARPETQLTMFNNLTAPKRLVLMPADDHTDPHTEYRGVQSAWWQAAAAGEPLPMK